MVINNNNNIDIDMHYVCILTIHYRCFYLCAICIIVLYYCRDNKENKATGYGVKLLVDYLLNAKKA